jgi:putative flippase GtrA
MSRLEGNRSHLDELVGRNSVIRKVMNRMSDFSGEKPNLFMQRMRDHLWITHQMKVRFILVGIWNTIFGYLVFVGFDYLFNLFFSPRYVAYMTAALLSNVIAVTHAYFFHKHLTFKSRARGRAAVGEYLRFYTTYLFTSIISLILLPVCVEFFKLDPKIVAAVMTLLMTFVSFISHNHFSFRRS